MHKGFRVFKTHKITLLGVDGGYRNVPGRFQSVRRLGVFDQQPLTLCSYYHTIWAGGTNIAHKQHGDPLCLA